MKSHLHRRLGRVVLLLALAASWSPFATAVEPGGASANYTMVIDGLSCAGGQGRSASYAEADGALSEVCAPGASSSDGYGHHAGVVLSWAPNMTVALYMDYLLGKSLTKPVDVNGDGVLDISDLIHFLNRRDD